MPECTRRITFCAGHRVFGHESKCAHPHGHNYVAEITAETDSLDYVGRVVDFGVIRGEVGAWVELHWDHAFLVYEHDHELRSIFASHPHWRVYPMSANPTAENIAAALLGVSQELLGPHGVRVKRVRILETENCWADAVPD